MTYGEATPTYNSGSRKIVNYKDFLQHDKEEEQELKDMKRKFKKNELEVGNQEHMSKYNKVTHKNDDMVEDEVDDSLETFKENNKSESPILIEMKEMWGKLSPSEQWKFLEWANIKPYTFKESILSDRYKDDLSEKTYSKEEVVKLIRKFNMSLPATQGMTGEGVDSWISKNL